MQCARSSAVKDELLISGNDVDMVSHSAALISGQCHVRKKDIRKYLDGIYIAERGLVVKVRFLSFPVFILPFAFRLLPCCCPGLHMLRATFAVSFGSCTALSSIVTLRLGCECPQHRPWAV